MWRLGITQDLNVMRFNLRSVHGIRIVLAIVAGYTLPSMWLDDKALALSLFGIGLMVGMVYLWYSLEMVKEDLANALKRDHPRHALMMQYSFQLAIDLHNLSRFLNFTPDEMESAKQWEPFPNNIIWQRWSGGYERLDIKYKQHGFPISWLGEHGSASEWETAKIYNVPASQQLRNQTYEAFDCRYESVYSGLVDPVWIGMLDKKSGAACFLTITKERILLYAIGGRFGISWKDNRPPEPWQDKKGEPRSEFIIMDVPLSTHCLKSAVSIDPVLSPTTILCMEFSEETNKRGVKWWLNSHDHRRVETGRVEALSADDNVVSFVYGLPKTRVKHRLKDKGWLSVGDKATAVFNEDGTIADMWK